MRWARVWARVWAACLTVSLVVSGVWAGHDAAASDADGSPGGLDRIERSDLAPLQYGGRDRKVDLGVGLWAWPLPMDVNGDGVHDLLVSSPGTPYNGLYYYENTGSNAHPLFDRPKRLSNGIEDVAISHVDGKAIVTSPKTVYPDVTRTGFAGGERIAFDGKVHDPGPDGRIRGNQWTYVDYDDDGALDIVVGIGDWTDYGWDDAYDENGNWTNGPLHGYVYLLRNTATTKHPEYAHPVKVEAGGKPIDMYGQPSPVLADFTGDGDLDIITGEFLDTLRFFDNEGSRSAPEYQQGRVLQTDDGKPLKMDLEMIVVSALDWTRDGDVDLVVGQEDGRVALIENTGHVRDGMPVFKAPRFFQQRADLLKFGVLSTPSAVDWDGDGKQDLIAGDSAGRISFIRNIGGGDPPKWAEPVRLRAEGKEIRHQAGPNGSVQGPAEAKWGYTVPVVADWNSDGLPDIVVNDIWGKVVWYENVGTRTDPKLAASRPIEVAWKGKTPKPEWNWWDPKGDRLVTQWRTTPYATDLNKDGLTDLVMLDQEGYLAFYERAERHGKTVLLPGKRIFIGEEGSSRFDQNGDAQPGARGPLQLNTGDAGSSGRRKFTMADWTGDGKLDLIVNNDTNVGLLKNVGTDDHPWVFRDVGSISNGDLAGHTTSPTVVNFDGNSTPDLLIGAEDGHFYYQQWNDAPDTPRTSDPPSALRTLVGSWGFNERRGSRVRDRSGYRNYGVVEGASRIHGYTGGGLKFDGFNDYVDLDYTVGPYLDGAPGITISAWARPETLESGTRRLFGTRIDGGRAGVEVTYDDANGRPRLAVAGRSTATDGYQKVVFATPDLRPGHWHHVAAVLDYQHDGMRLYVDGVRQNPVDDAQASFAEKRYRYGEPTQEDAVGRSPDGSAYARGSLDNVKVWRTPVTHRAVVVDLMRGVIRHYSEFGQMGHGLANRLDRELKSVKRMEQRGRDAKATRDLRAFVRTLSSRQATRHASRAARDQLRTQAERALS